MIYTHRMTPMTQNQTSRQGPLQLPKTTWGWYTGLPGLRTMVDGFTPISLEKMEAVALLDRTDTKFVMTTGQLLAALAALKQDYWILSINSQRMNHYRTLYFDTPDFELYRMHVNGRAERYKVRSREYTDSCQSFLEVKHKTRKGRTIKDRLSTARPVVRLTPETEDWLHDAFPYNSKVLEPKTWNTFTRLTLVSRQYCERVTLDLDLAFYNTDKIVQLGGIAVAEVKMDAGGCSSPFLAQMRAQRIRPRGFSKYCIGVAMLYDQVKKNNLKPKLLWIEKITGGVYHE